MFKLAIKSQLCPTKLTNQPGIATLSFGETKHFSPVFSRAGARACSILLWVIPSLARLG
jgi:hypothetical protein